MLSLLRRSLSLAIPTLLLASGCAVGAIEDTDAVPVVQVSDETEPATQTPAANDATQPRGEPVYFGESNYLDSPEQASPAAQPATYTFELLAESNVAISLARRTSSGPAVVGFTAYRFDADERTSLGRAQGTNGAAMMTLHTKYGGTYVVELLTGLDPETLVLDLACLGGACAPSRQPGETCATTGSMQCDDGLVCRFEDGTCKTPNSPGRCEIPPKECTSDFDPVCGCDGKTWGNDCFARRAGVSVLGKGSCDTK